MIIFTNLKYDIVKLLMLIHEKKKKFFLNILYIYMKKFKYIERKIIYIVRYLFLYDKCFLI